MDPNQGAVMDERDGYYDPRTGKKVYYPNVMYMTDTGVNVDNSSPVLGGSAEYNDYFSSNNLNHVNLKDFILGGINDIVSLEDPMNTLYQTLGIFVTNYDEMKDANTIGADKYFHARANLESAQRGIVGETIAKLIGDLREWTDFYRNTHQKGYSPEESLKDIQEDLEANQEGRDLGRKYPQGNPYELLKHRIPQGFPDRYKKY